MTSQLIALRRISLASAIMAFALVVWGAIVRVNGAGMTCPDWPRCQGRWLPALDDSTLYEWSHRVGAAAVTLIIVATFVAAFAARREAREAFVASWFSVALIVAQVAAGALTIALRNNPPSVAIHLVLGFLTFISLLVVAVIAYRTPTAQGQVEPPPGLAAMALLTTLIAFVAIFAAGFMSAANDGLACIGFPLCSGWAGAASDAQALHMGHRFAAYVTVAAVIVTFVIARPSRDRRPDLYTLASVALGLALLQGVLGAAAVVSRLNPIVRVGHEANGALLAASLVLLTYRAFRTRAPA